MHEMYNETADRPPHRELRPLLFSTMGMEQHDRSTDLIEELILVVLFGTQLFLLKL